MKQEHVGDRLNDLMQAHPLYRGRGGQSALGRKTGVPQPTINRILGKKSIPETGTLAKLATEFGVTTDWLLTGRFPKYNVDTVTPSDPPVHVETSSKQQSGKGKSTSEMPDYVVDAISSIISAYKKNAPREAFDAVRILLSQLAPQESGKVTSQQKDETVKKSASSMRSIKHEAEKAIQDAENRLATRSGGSRAGSGSGERRSKGFRH